MYERILVALDHTAADQALIPEISKLARVFKAQLILVHVADGWVARNYDQMTLSESEEMKDDRNYLEETAQTLQAQGFKISTQLALGDPPKEILKIARDQGCNLIAMTTHGHRLIGDILFGSTIEEVRHSTDIPLFIVHARK